MRAIHCAVLSTCATLASSAPSAFALDEVTACLDRHPPTLHEHAGDPGWGRYQVIRDWTGPIIVDSETGPDEETIYLRTVANCGCSIDFVTISERRSRTHHVGAGGTASWSQQAEAQARLLCFAAASVKARAGIEFAGEFNVTREVVYHISHQFYVFPGNIERFTSSVDRYAARVHLNAHPAKWYCYKLIGDEWSEGTCGGLGRFTGDGKGSVGTLDQLDYLGKCGLNQDCDRGETDS